MTGNEFIEKITSTLLSWVSKREVKTPLSFFFRIVAALVVIGVTALVVCEPARRFQVFYFLVGTLVLIFGLVLLFAWLRPKHLVYGETGHRAELRLGLGTEKKEIAPSELAALPGTTNPQAIQTTGES